MSSKSTSCALACDILAWHVPEEVIMVLLKDRTTVWVLNWKTGQPIEFRSIAENGGGHV